MKKAIKFYLLLGILIVSKTVFCQIDSVPRLIEKSIVRYYQFPDQMQKDSCYYINTLLQIKLDNKSNVISINFSDNAGNWLTQGLAEFNMKLDKTKIKAYAKRDGIKNVSIIIPLIIQSVPSACHSREGFYWFNEKYYRFNSIQLYGKCMFLEPAQITVMGSFD